MLNSNLNGKNKIFKNKESTYQYNNPLEKD